MKNWINKIIKVFGLRSLIVLIKNKNLLFSFKLIQLLKQITELSNLRTVAAIAGLPLFFRLLNMLLDVMKYFDTNTNRVISMFISSFACILMEERTQLTNYIILAIMVRVIHNVLSLIFKKYNIFQEDSKLNNYLAFTGSSVLWFLAIFLNPSFEAITKLSDRYSNYTAKEIPEMAYIRNITRIDNK